MYRAERQHIPEGDPGIERTLRAMDRLMDRGSGQPRVIRQAREIVRGVPERDTDAEANALLSWVRSVLRYTHDPIGKEVVADPDYMLREHERTGSIAEDCDSAVVLLGALMRSIGIEAQPVVVSGDGGTYSHVLLRYKSPKLGWTTADPITRNGLGWFPSGAVRVGVYRNGRIAPSTPLTVQGLGGYPGAPLSNAPPRESPIRRALDAIEPINSAVWFVVGLAVVRRWLKTGKVPI